MDSVKKSRLHPQKKLLPLHDDQEKNRAHTEQPSIQYGNLPKTNAIS